MMRRTITIKWVTILVAVIAATNLGNAHAQSDDNAAAVGVLQTYCYGCHTGDAPKSNFQLGTRESAMAGGKSGEPGIVPGVPMASRLVKLITLPEDNDLHMPPKGKPQPKPEEILALIHWIGRGAEWAAPATTTAAVPAPAPAPAATPAPTPAQPAAAPAKISFAQDIRPILQERCVTCHGPEKQKADLRLDSSEEIIKGEVVVPGKPGESELCLRISLPADHVDIMPAKGDPLTKEQIALIAKWITEGAAFDEAPTQVADAAPVADTASAKPAIPASTALDELAKVVAPPAEAALEALRAVGAVAMPLGKDSPLVQVDFKLAADKVTDETLALLQPLAEQITWLSLAGAQVTDDQLKHIESLKNLTRLHLEKTGVTDAGLSHLAGLTRLEYINLYKTAVTDAGVAALASLKELRNIYLWQTQVTEAGAKVLTDALPYAKVNIGSSFTPVVAQAEAPAEGGAVKLAFLFDEGSCCAKAAADGGKACDHDCCKEAAAKNTVCTKCNATAAAKLKLVAAFDDGSCCAKALAEGKACDHPCCIEAWKAAKVCEKCNVGTVAKAKLISLFDEGGCCAKAAALGKACDHPCCVEATKAGKVCEKCNPKAATANPAAADGKQA